MFYPLLEDWGTHRHNQHGIKPRDSFSVDATLNHLRLMFICVLRKTYAYTAVVNDTCNESAPTSRTRIVVSQLPCTRQEVPTENNKDDGNNADSRSGSVNRQRDYHQDEADSSGCPGNHHVNRAPGQGRKADAEYAHKSE